MGLDEVFESVAGQLRTNVWLFLTLWLVTLHC